MATASPPYLDLTPATRASILARQARGRLYFANHRLDRQLRTLKLCRKIGIDPAHLLPELWALRRAYMEAEAAAKRSAQ